MAVMHWCWSLNKISSPAPWIRVVKRFSCNILSSPHVKKWRGKPWLCDFDMSVTVLHCSSHSLSNFKVCCNKWNHRGKKSEERWHIGLTYFSQVLRLSKLASVVSAFSHCQLEQTEQNNMAAPDIPLRTVPEPLLIIVFVGNSHLILFCTVICICSTL